MDKDLGTYQASTHSSAKPAWALYQAANKKDLL